MRFWLAPGFGTVLLAAALAIVLSGCIRLGSRQSRRNRKIGSKEDQ